MSGSSEREAAVCVRRWRWRRYVEVADASEARRADTSNAFIFGTMNDEN